MPAFGHVSAHEPIGFSNEAGVVGARFFNSELDIAYREREVIPALLRGEAAYSLAMLPIDFPLLSS